MIVKIHVYYILALNGWLLKRFQG